MTEAIRGVAAGQPVAGAPRQMRGPSGFRVPQARTAAAGPAHGVEEVGLAGMLALQELPDPALADREARRRGHDILAALAELQRALLGPGGADSARPGGADAAGLAALAAAVPQADDPALRAVVAAITLRARIEAARHGIAQAEKLTISIESS